MDIKQNNCCDTKANCCNSCQGVSSVCNIFICCGDGIWSIIKGILFCCSCCEAN